ncbi:MAG: hypothetical protein JWQ11_1483 [Rhizobacter sp.]|nr:hypothetical protein [Rhizobacter sp.]
MKLHTVPARQGVQWVRHGFTIFFRRPLAFSGMFAAFIFGVLLLMLVPFVGPLLLLALLPLMSLAFMLATHTAMRGLFPAPTLFALPLRSGRSRLQSQIKLGLIYAGLTVIVMWLGDLLDGGTFDALQDAMSGGDATSDKLAELMSDGRLQFGMLARLTLASLLSVPFWHAPALVHWGDVSVGKALFASTVACWRNRGAFTWYALTWAGLIVIFGLLANVLFALLGRPELIAIAATSGGLLFTTVFYTSLYFTFASCFGAPVKVEPSTSPPPTTV